MHGAADDEDIRVRVPYRTRTVCRCCGGAACSAYSKDYQAGRPEGVEGVDALLSMCCALPQAESEHSIQKVQYEYFGTSSLNLNPYLNRMFEVY